MNATVRDGLQKTAVFCGSTVKRDGPRGSATVCQKWRISNRDGPRRSYRDSVPPYGRVRCPTLGVWARTTGDQKYGWKVGWIVGKSRADPCKGLTTVQTLGGDLAPHRQLRPREPNRVRLQDRRASRPPAPLKGLTLRTRGKNPGHSCPLSQLKMFLENTRVCEQSPPYPERTAMFWQASRLLSVPYCPLRVSRSPSACAAFSHS